jgi:hypothetical protein
MRFLFILLFFQYAAVLCAQEKELEIMAPYVLDGKWTGILTQMSGGISQEYAYEISLKLKGNNLSGNGSIKTGSLYAHFEIRGHLDGSAVYLEDLRITNEKMREMASWCIKKMPLKLKFRGGAYRLEGPWSGKSSYGPCTPGQIYLKKETVRA